MCCSRMDMTRFSPDAIQVRKRSRPKIISGRTWTSSGRNGGDKVAVRTSESPPADYWLTKKFISPSSAVCGLQNLLYGRCPRVWTVASVSSKRRFSVRTVFGRTVHGGHTQCTSIMYSYIRSVSMTCTHAALVSCPGRPPSRGTPPQVGKNDQKFSSRANGRHGKRVQLSFLRPTLVVLEVFFRRPGLFIVAGGLYNVQC